MKRRNILQLFGIGFLWSKLGFAASPQLVTVTLPAPSQLRPGWAALAAVCAARGWSNDTYATDNQWHFHDGGGNWVKLRKIGDDQVVLIGHDHEYSDTYFREGAAYFQEEETDLLAGAPKWWSQDLSTGEFENWVGFIYGWNGNIWQRARYNKEDGFHSVGLLNMCVNDAINTLKEYASDAPGLTDKNLDDESVKRLLAADGHFTAEMLNAVVPGWDIEAGIKAGKQFLAMKL